MAQVLVLGAVAAVPACAQPGESFDIGGFQYDADRFVQWKLPKRLREISGLALDGRQRLFAHDDEHAVIYQLDYAAGRLVKRFSLGSPPLAGDFEGIAVARDRFYLITSRGDLYSAPEGEDGEAVAYDLTRTDLGKRCEIEGLAFLAVSNELLVACKTARESALEDVVAVFRWSLTTNAPSREEPIRLSLAEIGPLTGTQRFHTSGIDVSPGNGNLVLVAARERALLEATLNGELRGATTLPPIHSHPQTEGIALTQQGDLILADEGGNKKGRLSVYAAQ
jgi:uncharacterized protein YjiK